MDVGYHVDELERQGVALAAAAERAGPEDGPADCTVRGPASELYLTL
jgi:hypothetical protein